ncbi:flavin reductase [Rhodobacteraceae bacterium NNCM2]|nr:flavin reductase [Coraliihabitans acroporae]
MTARTQDDQSDQRLRLRQAFGNFATGVTVVTTRTSDGEPIGFTANSFTSVSLEPPLLLVCLAKSSANVGHFSRAEHFSVNILGEAQKDVSNRFASRVPDRFAETNWREGASGVPLIDDALAWFDCETHNVVDAGDHIILLGRVADFDQVEGRPLAYFRGHYLDLGLAEAAADSVSHNGGVRVGCLLDCQGQVLLRRTPLGWSLPMGDVRPGFREGRASLEAMLADEGIAAELGFLYSVFDAPSGNAAWLIFHGEMEFGALSDDLRLFPLAELPLREVAQQPMRSVLRRYQSESEDARFGLYVDGSDRSGQVNPIDRNATPWNRLPTSQEKTT